ncbi:hypothetical protein BJV82DRAFT_522236 [Fennellomyces sp. T-0311]|nr:hypothetical protein BJV82DRAFT_522236 [Fennellomyces sp. T-0311]
MTEAGRKRKWQTVDHSSLPKRFHNDYRIDFTQTLLSNELVLHIFSFLSASDLARCSKVSSHWCRLASDELLWKPLFLRRFRNPLLLDVKGHPKLLKQWHEWSSRLGNRRSRSGWKSLYKTNHNWRIGYRLQTVTDMQHITCLKLDTSGAVHRLVVGYDRGGLSVWECATSDEDGFSAAEVAVYTPKVMRVGRIVSIGVCYPMVLTCSSDMRLSAFCIEPTDHAANARLLYELQSHIRWHPISVDLDRCDDQSDRWRAMICFGMPVGLNASSVGVQEVILSSETFVSSRHCAALGPEDMFFAPTSPGRTRPDNLQPITGISYSEPYLVTSHPNNTIKQYHVLFSKDKMELCYVQTLYGHTSKVCALSLDASIGRLVSGDRFGLKVWDISCSGKSNYIVSINGTTGQRATSGSVPFRDMEWLQFDSDKIVAVVRDEDAKAITREKVSVRIWSFAEGA